MKNFNNLHRADGQTDRQNGRNNSYPRENALRIDKLKKFIFERKR